jgi:hypothetical protein
LSYRENFLSVGYSYEKYYFTKKHYNLNMYLIPHTHIRERGTLIIDIEFEEDRITKNRCMLYDIIRAQGSSSKLKFHSFASNNI